MLNEYFSPVDFLILKPVILLTLFGVGVMLTDLLLEERHRYLSAVTALVGLGFAGAQMWMIQSQMRQAEVNQLEAFRGALQLDQFGIFFIWIFLISSAIAILLAIRYLEI